MIPILLADMYAREAGNVADVDNSDLEQLYRRLEKYLITEDLRMHVYVPILGAEISTERHYTDFSIVRLSDQQRRQLTSTSHVHPSDSIKLGSATHALEIKDVPALAGGCGAYFEVEPYEATFDVVNQFFEASSLESTSPVGYAQMIFSPNGWFGNVDAEGVTDSTYLCRDHPTRLDNLTRHSADLDSAAFDRIHDHFDRLNRGHPSLRVAARRLNRALSRESDEDRIVDLCIGLEAILGGGSGSGEIVHKISMRAGAMLSRSGWGGSGEILGSVKDIYSYRSKVVHGIPGPHKKQLIHVDEVPVHASRYALAALRQVLKTALQVEGFNPDKVDALFVYSALDFTALQMQEGHDPSEAP
nr:HEPN domain-containing protein [Streptomyces sp. MW-W600-10]